MAYQEKQTRGAFLRKLSYYLAGIAIGFVMLGVFQSLKKAHQAREQAASTQPQPSASQRGLFPPTPSEEAESSSVLGAEPGASPPAQAPPAGTPGPGHP